MKVALVYNPNDYKLRVNSYSQTYRHMILTLIKTLTAKDISVQHICQDISAKDIEADIILFYDIHSNYHIIIDGIEKHSAIKYEYFDDPHQTEVTGRYSDGTPVHKLGAQPRCQRAIARGVSFIISPYYDAYFRFLAPYLNGRAKDMLINFPISPDISLFNYRHKGLVHREPTVLANGATAGDGSLYEFRKWAFCQRKVTLVPHSLKNSNTPTGEQYPDMLLSRYAGVLALADWQAVPKYFEVPLAGCVAFMQWNSDAYRWGFRDHQNCVFVEESNFNERIDHFLNHIIDYQDIASMGRELVEHNYTAQHFADFIYNHFQSQID